jgi:hypothetical protein
MREEEEGAGGSRREEEGGGGRRRREEGGGRRNIDVNGYGGAGERREPICYRAIVNTLLERRMV